MILINLQRAAQQRLGNQRDTANLEIQLLLAHACQKTRSWVMAHPEASLTLDQIEKFEQALQRLQDGEPLPYILGHWEFYGLDFMVSPAVLIPRPETELMVEKAGTFLRKGYARNEPFDTLTAIDVGTGSGCIAISLAVHNPQLHLVATDISRDALKVAQNNVVQHRCSDQIALVEGELLACFSSEPTFNLVCANLPYIPSDRLPNLPVYGREPTLALDGGSRGWQVIRRLLQQSRTRMKPGGLLLLEIDTSQQKEVIAQAGQVFPTASLVVYKDLAGKDRLVAIQIPA